jgi:translocation and assembly module TamB
MTSHQPKQNQIRTQRFSKKRSLLLMLLLIIVLTATAGTWLLTTPSGTQWLLSTVSRASSGSIVFTGVNGTISELRTESILFISEDLTLTIHDFELDWQPEKLFAGQLKIRKLAALNVEVLAPPSEEPTDPVKMPESLQLPLAISIELIKLDALRVFAERSAIPDAPIFSATEISARVNSDGQQHQLSDFQIHSDLGTLRASVQLNGAKPFNLDANVKFTGLTRLADMQLPASRIAANISGDLTQLIVKFDADGKVIKGNGAIALQPFAAFPVAALRASIEDLNPKTFSPDIPTASISMQTDLRTNAADELTGNVTIKNSQTAALDQDGLPFHEVGAKLTLSPDLFQLEKLAISLADSGVISGNLSWQNTQSTGSADLTVSQLNPLALDTRLQPAKINGNIKLDGDTETQQGIIALKDESLHLDARLSHTDQTVTLEKLQLRRHQSALTGQGKLNLDAQQFFYFNGKLTQFNLSDFLQEPASNLNLALKLEGNLSPQITGSVNFKFEDSQLAAQPVSGSGLIESSYPDQIKANIDLMIGSNSLRTRGSFGKPGDRLQLEIAAPKLDQTETGISGALNMKASLFGSFSSPAIRLDMQGSNLALPGDHQLNHLSGYGHLQDESISLKLTADDYRTENKEQLQNLSINVSGKKIHHLFQVNAQIDDDMAINLLAEGGLSKSSTNNQPIQWNGELSQFSTTGPLPFSLVTTAKLELSKERVFLGATKLIMAGGQLSIDKTLWTPQQWHSQGEFSNISVRPGGLTDENKQSLQLGGEWDIESAKELSGHLQIRRENGDWILPGDFPQPLGLQALQLTGQAENGNLRANLTIQGENIGKTAASISLPLTRQNANWTVLPDAPLNGLISANIEDISWVGQMLDKNITSGGKFSLDAKLTGTLDNPVLDGKATGENLALAMLDQGLRLEEGKLAARFDQASVQIDTLKFSAPNDAMPDDYLLDNLKLSQEPGVLKISGVIDLAGKKSNVEIELDRLPIARETNYWIVASGNTDVDFSEDSLTITGKITADAGLIAQPPSGHPQLADDIIVGEQPSQTSQAPEKQMINLDATLDLGKHFYIRVAGLEGRLTGRLNLSSNERTKLYATGSISTHNTVFEAYGQKLTVERGIVNFNGPLDNPGLNVLAVRQDLPVEAGVEVLGTVRRPKIQLVSTPEVSDAEKLSWIIAGRSLESGGVDSALLLSAAGSILGGQPGKGGITRQLSQALGVDEISFRQSDTATDDGNPLSNQIGSVGKRLSSRAYLSYEHGLTTTTDTSVAKLTYSLTPKIKVVTQAGTDSAIDLFYTIQFD